MMTAARVHLILIIGANLETYLDSSTPLQRGYLYVFRPSREGPKPLPGAMHFRRSLRKIGVDKTLRSSLNGRPEDASLESCFLTNRRLDLTQDVAYIRFATDVFWS